jgi:hypothetical protein
MSPQSVLSIALCTLTLLASAARADTAGTRTEDRSVDRGRASASVTRPEAGGYSYQPADVVGGYGRSWTSIVRPEQSPAGPFDSGFFFDSGLEPQGGNSPYLH